jgi:uncharacterized protein (TIGR02599 family)
MSASKAGGKPAGFSLIELLVSTAIVAVLLVLMITVMMQASSVWRRSSSNVEAFQSARLAFDVITRNLSQATLNTYLDYDNPSAPTRYYRVSELACRIGPAGSGGLPGTPGTGQAVFFQAPLGYATNLSGHGGLESVLSACGYFVSYTTNSSVPQHVAASGNPPRYRLMQVLVPTEDNDIYKSASGSAWISNHTNAAVPVADNVIALVVRPQDPAASQPDITAGYAYDTRLNATADPQPDSANQLPPVVQVTMVAVDEAAAARPQSATAIAAALTGKFSTTASYQEDLDDLGSKLTEARIPYRIFSSAVPIRESKWTK